MLQFPLPNKTFRNEAEFTTWFGRQVKEKGGFRHKISDMSIELKPFDAILAFNGYVAAAEIKVSDHKRKVNVSKMLRDNQRSGLSKYKKNGGNALVIYYNKIVNKYFIREYTDEDIIVEF